MRESAIKAVSGCKHRVVTNKTNNIEIRIVLLNLLAAPVFWNIEQRSILIRVKRRDLQFMTTSSNAYTDGLPYIMTDVGDVRFAFVWCCPTRKWESQLNVIKMIDFKSKMKLNECRIHYLFYAAQSTNPLINIALPYWKFTHHLVLLFFR